MKAGTILGIAEIKTILPFRNPMLMLDRVQVESETRLIGLKNLSTNENFFQGHFPGHQIMPGVLQVETMKQLGQIAVTDRLDPQRTGEIYLKKVEKVKFRKPNTPGDRIKAEIDVLEIAGGEARISGKISNKSGVASQAVMTLAVRPPSVPAEMPELWTEFDKDAATAQDVHSIMKYMPHRYPFLFIDHIASSEGSRVVSVKNITGNEPVFQGYVNDDRMTLPESYLCEIAAQAGCACMLARPENQNKLGFFMAIDEAESLAPVLPGDQIICEALLPDTEKSRFGKSSTVMRVGNKDVFRITLTFAIVDP